MASFETGTDIGLGVTIRSKDISTTPLRFKVEDLVALRDSFTSAEREGADFSPDTLARFLIARNGNVDKAKTLLVEHLAWRRATLPVLKSSCLNEFTKGKMFVHGVDKEGHPLIIYRAKLQVPSERDMDEMLRMCTWWAEKVISMLPPDKSKATILVDRSDASLTNMDFEFVKAMAGIFQNNYPERLYRAIIYPSGIVFYTFWNLIKFFLDPVTQHKVQPVLTLAGVQEFIDDECIPSHMGGKSKYEFDPANDQWADPL